MYTPLITISAIIAVGILFVLTPLAIDNYRRYRNRKVVICPENQNLAEVDLKPLSCRRWPNRNSR